MSKKRVRMYESTVSDWGLLVGVWLIGDCMLCGGEGNSCTRVNYRRRDATGSPQERISIFITARRRKSRTHSHLFRPLSTSESWYAS